jgi:hypothetical protein
MVEAFPDSFIIQEHGFGPEICRFKIFFYLYCTMYDGSGSLTFQAEEILHLNNLNFDAKTKQCLYLDPIY